MGVFDDLPLNKKISIEVPQDLIPIEGIEEVNRYLYDELMPLYSRLREYADYDRFLNRDFPRDWVLTKGGTFPKRVSHFMYSQRKIKLTAEQMTQIGNIAKRHTTNNSEFVFDITDAFDWRAGDFGDANSCYWNSSRFARKLLKFYKARAIRFYNPQNPEKGMARAWLAPLSEAILQDSNGTQIKLSKEQRENAIVVFNGYGHETQRCARVLSTHLKLNYRQVALSNFGQTNGTLWINHYTTNEGGRVASASFLLGGVDLIEPVRNIDLRFDQNLVDAEDCAGTCGRRFRPREMHHIHNHYYCSSCYTALFFTCNHCQDSGLRSESRLVVIGTLRGLKNETWCQNCLSREAFICTNCHEAHSLNIKIEPEESTDPWCRSCFVSNYKRCETCEIWKPVSEINKAGICKTCR